MKYQFLHPVELSIEDIDDIIVGAIKGGIDYWLVSCEYKPLVKGGYLYIQSSDHDPKTLTIRDFVDGLELYYKHNNVLLEDMDVSDYDVIIQYAYFGEVVYG
jgi:hypothetical protein